MRYSYNSSLNPLKNIFLSGNVHAPKDKKSNKEENYTKEITEMAERERDIERKLVQGVKALGGIAYKWVSPGHDGVPDRIVVFPGGRVEFVELKTSIGRISPIQQAQIARLKALEQVVIVLYGLDEVTEYLARHGGPDAI